MGPLLLLALVLFLLLLFVLRRRRRPRERPGPVKEAARRGGGGRRALPDGEENLRPALQAAAHRGLGGRQDLRPLPLLRRCLQHHLHLHHWSVLFRPAGLRSPRFSPPCPPIPFLCHPQGPPPSVPLAALLCHPPHPQGSPLLSPAPPGTPSVTHQQSPGTRRDTQPCFCVTPRDPLCHPRSPLLHSPPGTPCVPPGPPCVTPSVPTPSCPRQSRPGAARRRRCRAGWVRSLPPSALGDPERPSLSPPRGLRWQLVPHALCQPPEPTWPLPSALIPVPAGGRAVGSPSPCLHRG